jgi:hypothetical protein
MHYFYDYVWHTLSASHYIVWCGFRADSAGTGLDDEQQKCNDYLRTTGGEVHVLCVQYVPQVAFATTIADADRRDRLWLFVSEQTTISDVAALYACERRRFPNVRFLHYSDANAVALRAVDSGGGRARHFVVPFVPCETTYFRHYWAAEKRYDVAFVGHPSARRETVLAELRRRGHSVQVVRAFGGDRDAALAQSRVLVNVHFRSDYRVLESLRRVQAAMCGLLVVTEPSVPQRHSAIERTFITADSDQQLVATVERVLQQYATLHERHMRFLNQYAENGAVHCAADFSLLAAPPIE